MTDIRRQLNERLEQLRATADEDARWVAGDAAPTSKHYERAARNLAELRTVEATLATMQLADAQDRLSRSQREVAEAQREATAQTAKDQSRSEEVAFWSRRYLTTISVANAAALVAVLSFVMEPGGPLVADSDVARALHLFWTGALIGGTFPLLRIWALRLNPANRTARALRIVTDWVLPGIATGTFLWGMMIVIGCARGYYAGLM